MMKVVVRREMVKKLAGMEMVVMRMVMLKMTMKKAMILMMMMTTTKKTTYLKISWISLSLMVDTSRTLLEPPESPTTPLHLPATTTGGLEDCGSAGAKGVPAKIALAMVQIMVRATMSSHSSEELRRSLRSKSVWAAEGVIFTKRIRPTATTWEESRAPLGQKRAYW